MTHFPGVDLQNEIIGHPEAVSIREQGASPTQTNQALDQHSMASGQLSRRFQELQSNGPVCSRTYKKDTITKYLLIYHRLIKLFETDEEDYVTCKNSGCKMARVLFSSKMPLHSAYHTLVPCFKADAAGFLAKFAFRHVRATDLNLLHGLTKGKDSSNTETIPIENTTKLEEDHQRHDSRANTSPLVHSSNWTYNGLTKKTQPKICVGKEM